MQLCSEEIFHGAHTAMSLVNCTRHLATGVGGDGRAVFDSIGNDPLRTPNDNTLLLHARAVRERSKLAMWAVSTGSTRTRWCLAHDQSLRRQSALHGCVRPGHLEYASCVLCSQRLCSWPAGLTASGSIWLPDFPSRGGSRARGHLILATWLQLFYLHLRALFLVPSPPPCPRGICITGPKAVLGT